MAESVVIPTRFNGPAESGQGGYVSGVLGELLGGVAAVSLRAPVPLGRPLAVEREDPSSLRLLDGETLIAEAEAVSDFDLEVPEPVGVPAAGEASGRYRGISGELFSSCFVCGVDREDSLRIFAGAVEGRDLAACSWQPPDWTGDVDGRVEAEIVAAVLDCPTYFAAYPDRAALSFLARFTFELLGEVEVGREHVVIAWPLGGEGRKRTAGSAVLAADGRVLARAEALLVEPRGGG